MIRHIARTHEWRPTRMTAEIHQATHGEGDNARRLEIAIWTTLTEAGDRSHDQRGIDGSQRSVTQLMSVEKADGFVFDQHIGVACQLAQSLATLIGVKIEHNTA